MSGLDYYANEAPLPEGTLAELFMDAVDRHGDKDAFLYFVDDTDRMAHVTYPEAFESVRAAAAALEALGLQRGDRAAILSGNRPEWAMADYGCICAGVVDVPIYPTLLDDQVAYILENAEVKVVFAEDAEQAEKARSAAELNGRDVRLVVFEGEVEGALDWDAFLAIGRERGVSAEDFRAGARMARPQDVTTLIYTSGTTGTPKGVMLTHDNLFTNVEAAGRALRITNTDVTLSFLPLSHVFQRMVDYLFFRVGCTIGYAHDIRTVAADLKVVRPTVAVSVPRLYEKVYNAVMAAEGVKRVLVQWAREVGAAWADQTLAGRRPTALLKLVYAVADRLVFRKIRAGVGGRLRFFISGGAPLEPAIATFFYSVGLPILEGYGLTETSPVTNVNTLEDFRIGTVGKPVSDTEIRIAPDGEILIRGRQVMKGYHGDPEATRAVIDQEGWFHSGDIGEIDADGFLRITDRKKDLIVTAGGKNIAPQAIENRLKTNPFVEQLVMVGDKRHFCSLLLVPSFPQLEGWARGKGLVFQDRAELIALPEVHTLIEQEILGGLDDLASYERPKKVALLAQEFSIEDGTLTPTQKVKRRVVQAKFDDLIDRLYLSENVDTAVFVG